MNENIGAVVSLVNLAVTICGGVVFLMNMKSRQEIIDVLLKRLSQDVERLSATVEALRRGDGWIQSPLHRSVDREYN
jgi:hypothetical protein